MHCLFLSNYYPPYELGGLEQLTWEVASRLRTRGHAVGVLTTRSGAQASPREQEEHVIRSLYAEAPIHYYSIQSYFLQRRGQEAANREELRCAIESVRPDVLVVWNMWNLSRRLPYWAEQWLPGRVAYYIASTWPMDPDIHHEYWNLPALRPSSEWLKRILRALALSQLQREGYPPSLDFAHAMCVSSFLRDSLVAAQAIPTSAGVLYNGIEPGPFVAAHSHRSEPAGHPLRLLYFGGLIPIKGVHVAIQAMQLLRQQGLADRVVLTIRGRGHPDYVERLHAMVAESGLGQCVRFEDWIPRSGVPDMLKEHDVLLFTSTGPEAMARTVMEGMAAGLTVAGTPVGGQREMLEDGINALVFPPDHAAGLAACILRLHRDPALRTRLAEAGRRTVLERFALDRMVDQMEAWLEEVASG